MQQIRLWYNSHRKKIWITVGIIAAVIAIVQFLNFLYSISSDNTRNNRIAISDEKENLKEIEKETNVSYESGVSVISGETISKEKLKTAAEVIGEFFDFCNEGNIQGAYDLLTDDCKEQIYTSLESFEKAYYQDVFAGEERIYSVENWIGDIYKVDITENMLATGKSNNGYVKQDYITVEKVDDVYKLNINNYIGKTQINKETDKEDIKVNVLYKNTYMDREEYTISVTNNKATSISLDRLYDVNSLYLEDSKGMKYPAYTHEMTSPMLEVQSKETKEVTIKFYSRYTSNKNIENLVFSDLVIWNDQLTSTMEFKAEV